MESCIPGVKPTQQTEVSIVSNKAGEAKLCMPFKIKVLDFVHRLTGFDNYPPRFLFWFGLFPHYVPMPLL